MTKMVYTGWVALVGGCVLWTLALGFYGGWGVWAGMKVAR